MNTAVSYVTATDNDIDQRVDNFLIKQFKNVPKSYLYRIIRKGELRVNKKRVKADYRLQVGDVVRIPPLRIDDPSTPRKIPPHWKQFIQNAILEENNDFMVINKPAGIAVHAGTGDAFGIIEILRDARQDATFLELVHRLDKETSGCLLIAKKRPALLKLHKMIKLAEITKIYTLITHGLWPRQLKSVALKLQRGGLAEGQRGMRVKETGKDSKTSFTLKKHVYHFSLVEANLHTGKMHQIRVHANESGYPIVGDKKYGNWDADKKVLKNKQLQHMYLHASRLEFEWEGKQYNFLAPLPEYFDRLLAH